MRALSVIAMIPLTGVVPFAAQEAMLDPIEGIVAEDLEGGATVYQCREERRAEADVFLSPMLIRTASGTRLLYIGLYLREVNDGQVMPLGLAIDGSKTYLAIPTDYMKMEVVAGRTSATTTIQADAKLMRRIASAQIVEASFEARKFALKAAVTAEDRERFRRILDLADRGSLPPAALLPGPRPSTSSVPLATGRLEEGVWYPELIKKTRVKPHYPAEALANRIRGQVVLAIRVLEDGTVGTLRPLRVEPEGLGFAKSAMDAVRRWKYRPALKAGEPIDSDFTVVVDFVGPH